MKSDDLKIAVIGLGYVGLPLAIEFGKNREVVGFDINESRIDELNKRRRLYPRMFFRRVARSKIYFFYF